MASIGRGAQAIKSVTLGDVFGSVKNALTGGAKGTYDAYQKSGSAREALYEGFKGHKGGFGSFGVKRPVYELGADGKALLDREGNKIRSVDPSKPIKDKDGKVTGYEGRTQDAYLSGGKIAGAMSGIGVGYRVLSGGGLYRDKDGNVDIAGIPFI